MSTMCCRILFFLGVLSESSELQVKISFGILLFTLVLFGPDLLVFEVLVAFISVVRNSVGKFLAYDESFEKTLCHQMIHLLERALFLHEQ